jgi:hypothetical protein
MIVQDLVNALLQFPATMEVYLMRDEAQKLSEKFAAADSIIMGEAVTGQANDKDGNEISVTKQAVIIKGLLKKGENNG